jgi:septum formation protein
VIKSGAEWMVIMKIILASNSPRRRELLALMNLEFQVIAADIDETPLAEEDPQDYVIRMAADKARAVKIKVNPNSVVIASDTTVVDGDQILGKPRDDADAIRMLSQLRGRDHQVFTAIAVLNLDSDEMVTDICGTNVPMRNYSDEEMSVYVASGDPLDKAGAYAIQHTGFHPVENLRGCFANVMGLPLCHLTRLLTEFNLQVGTNVPSACQAALRYHCMIFDNILPVA